MKIIALRPVLYLAHQYEAGEELPVSDQGMVDAWLEAGSAKKVEDGQKAEPEKKAAKAKPASAQAGMTGTSSDGDQEAMPGRVPKTEGRKKLAK